MLEFSVSPPTPTFIFLIAFAGVNGTTVKYRHDPRQNIYFDVTLNGAFGRALRSGGQVRWVGLARFGERIRKNGWIPRGWRASATDRSSSPLRRIAERTGLSLLQWRERAL